jgi:dienelactone hydrolase
MVFAIANTTRKGRRASARRGWAPTHPGLVADIEEGHYFRSTEVAQRSSDIEGVKGNAVAFGPRLRLRCLRLRLDPHKIGVIGFSAGGHLVAALSTHFTERAYRAVDAADRESCRPDFAISTYPGHLRRPSPHCRCRSACRLVAPLRSPSGRTRS